MVEYTRDVVNYYLAGLKYETEVFSELVLGVRGWKELSIEEMKKVLAKAPYSSDLGFVKTVRDRVLDEKEGRIKFLEIVGNLEEDIDASRKSRDGLAKGLEKIVGDIEEIKKPVRVYLKRKGNYNTLRNVDSRTDLAFIHFQNYNRSLAAYQEVIGGCIDSLKREK